MSSFEIGAARPLSAVQVTAVGTSAKPVQTEPSTSQAAQPASAPAAAQVETSNAVKAGVAPVDQERVREIRQAIEAGKYPIVPAKIADAMIAAGMLLRSAHS